MYPSKPSVIDLRSKVRTPVSKTKMIFEELQRLSSSSRLSYSVTPSIRSSESERWSTPRSDKLNLTLPPRKSMFTPSRLQEYSGRSALNKPYWRLTRKLEDKHALTPQLKTVDNSEADRSTPSNVFSITDDDLRVDTSEISAVEEVLSKTAPLILPSAPSAGFLTSTAVEKTDVSVNTDADDPEPSIPQPKAVETFVFTFAEPLIRGPRKRKETIRVENTENDSKKQRAGSPPKETTNAAKLVDNVIKPAASLPVKVPAFELPKINGQCGKAAFTTVTTASSVLPLIFGSKEMTSSASTAGPEPKLFTNSVAPSSAIFGFGTTLVASTKPTTTTTIELSSTSIAPSTTASPLVFPFSSSASVAVSTSSVTPVTSSTSAASTGFGFPFNSNTTTTTTAISTSTSNSTSSSSIPAFNIFAPKTTDSVTTNSATTSTLNFSLGTKPLGTTQPTVTSSSTVSPFIFGNTNSNFGAQPPLFPTLGLNSFNSAGKVNDENKEQRFQSPLKDTNAKVAKITDNGDSIFKPKLLNGNSDEESKVNGENKTVEQASSSLASTPLLFGLKPAVSSSLPSATGFGIFSSKSDAVTIAPSAAPTNTGFGFGTSIASASAPAPASTATTANSTALFDFSRTSVPVSTSSNTSTNSGFTFSFGSMVNNSNNSTAPTFSLFGSKLTDPISAPSVTNSAFNFSLGGNPLAAGKPADTALASTVTPFVFGSAPSSNTVSAQPQLFPSLGVENQQSDTMNMFAPEPSVRSGSNARKVLIAKRSRLRK